jgi:Putative Flp pilus-assembly TadE/G-like
MRMSRSGRILALAGNERGAVLVIFAVFAPVAILFAAFAIDAGNWWLHKRHLQLQADAGALAAAQQFQPCVNEAIYKTAGQYSGAASVITPEGPMTSATPLVNLQTAGTSQENIKELINSQTYFSQTTPVDTSVSTAPPCTAGGMMVDIKLTENGLPWYFRPFSRLLSIVPDVNAHARVEIRQKTSTNGAFPVAINDLRPRAAEAYFVDESVNPATQLTTCGSAGNASCAVALKRDGSVNGLSTWDNLETAIPFAMRKPNVGVRIAIAGRASLTGNMKTDCEQSFVTCSDASSAQLGLLHIQGYSAIGTASVTSPIARQAQLSGAPGGCIDGYFSRSAASCTIAVSAHVDWGTPAPPTGADVDAIVNGTCYALTFQSTSGTNELWSSAGTAPAKSCANVQAKNRAGTGYVALEARAGATAIELQAIDTSATKKFGVVQRTYSAGANSEPVQEAFLGQVGGAPHDADSFRLCEQGNQGEACTPSLVVTVRLSGSLGDAQSVSDPIYTMRFSGTGSQNQSISCGGGTYAETLASGCPGMWGVNPTLTCPDTNTPVDCVQPATGNKENQVSKGMNLRILGSEKPTICSSPNHWNTFTFTNGVPNVSATDPRVVTVFITPYGSFSGSGASASYPITEFATFYVTGWQGQGNGFNNPCQGNGDDTAASGTIVGHFIKYTTLDASGGGTTICEPNALGQCVAVLTR